MVRSLRGIHAPKGIGSPKIRGYHLCRRGAIRGCGNHGALDNGLADRFVEAFGLPLTLFEAPDKYSQFSLINHFGGTVRLGNVRLEEILRVEIYRRGLHSDAFQYPNLRPSGPPTAD